MSYLSLNQQNDWMNKNINIGVIGIDHCHIFDMLDEMLKEGCTCNYFWTEG